MEKQIKELTLLLAYLTSWDEKDRLIKQEFKKSWKGYDYGIINKLDEEEYIYQENNVNVNKEMYKILNLVMYNFVHY